MTKNTIKSKIKEALDELLSEKEEEAKKDDKKRIMVEYSSEHDTHQPTTKGPYMVLYINPAPAPFRLNISGWMGMYSQMFTAETITCIEQPDNLERIELEEGLGRIKILLKDLKTSPTHEKMRELKAKHLSSISKPRPKPKAKPASSAKGKKSKAKKK